MELTPKDPCAMIPPSVSTLVATLSWVNDTDGVDFDLMVIAKPNGSSEYVAFYFGNQNDSAGRITLGADAGVGGAAGVCEEQATITDFSNGYDVALLCIIDYDMVCRGETGRFDTQTPTMTVTSYDSNFQQVGESHIIKPDGGMLDGNICAIGRLRAQGPFILFENVSTSSVLKGFEANALVAFTDSVLNSESTATA